MLADTKACASRYQGICQQIPRRMSKYLYRLTNSKRVLKISKCRNANRWAILFLKPSFPMILVFHSGMVREKITKIPTIAISCWYLWWPNDRNTNCSGTNIAPAVTVRHSKLAKYSKKSKRHRNQMFWIESTCRHSAGHDGCSCGLYQYSNKRVFQ